MPGSNLGQDIGNSKVPEKYCKDLISQHNKIAAVKVYFCIFLSTHPETRSCLKLWKIYEYAVFNGL
jgi:hypothetical protein